MNHLTVAWEYIFCAGTQILALFASLCSCLSAACRPVWPGSLCPDVCASICWQAFQESICHCLQKYCLNYTTALLYLDSLKPREDFGSYVKVGAAPCQVSERKRSDAAAQSGKQAAQCHRGLPEGGMWPFVPRVTFPVITLMYLSGLALCFWSQISLLFTRFSPPIPPPSALCSNKHRDELFHPSDLLLFPPLTLSLSPSPSLFLHSGARGTNSAGGCSCATCWWRRCRG